MANGIEETVIEAGSQPDTTEAQLKKLSHLMQFTPTTRLCEYFENKYTQTLKKVEKKYHNLIHT